jgi:hypothetical protein
VNVKRKIELILVALSFIFMAGMLVTWKYSADQLVALQQKIQSIQFQINALKKSQKQVPSSQSLPKETVQIDQNALPDQVNDTDFIDQLTDMANALGVTIKMIQLDSGESNSGNGKSGDSSTHSTASNGDQSKIKKSQSSIIGNANFTIPPSIHAESIEFSIDSPSDQYFEFLTRIQKLPRFVTLSSIQRTKSDQDDRIEAQISLTIYYIDPSTLQKMNNSNSNATLST